MNNENKKADGQESMVATLGEFAPSRAEIASRCLAALLSNPKYYFDTDDEKIVDNTIIDAVNDAIVAADLLRQGLENTPDINEAPHVDL